ncbi:efflux RND transporter permease subunit [Halalkalicoccus subterraneus]|uniref:efflux RND transporter permease subunit n=1 Tax=Halalkalicoccus subterraneus TaxID=2675002 RepID=UPI000EFC65BF|nr:MMPL family transporter [Halalkalicoccus subterraneus]
MSRFDLEEAIDRANYWITERSGVVIALFLVVTLMFSGGLGNIELDEGTQGFAEDVPAQDALDDVNQQFEPPFQDDQPSTQLIQRGDNVLTKAELVRMLTLQQRLEEDPEIRVESTTSFAQTVALTLDPTAETTAQQIDAVEGATRGEVREAVRSVTDEGAVAEELLSDDFNPENPSASATIATVSHTERADPAGNQERIDAIVDSVGGDVVVFGQSVIQNEFEAVIGDSLALVIPVVVVLILGFLIFSFRDPFDLLLGLVALAMTIIWTFGFTGLAGIPFSEMLIAVPPLLLAIGVDFGIHAINRYREERTDDRDPGEAMAIATHQLLVAFFIVAGTTVIGFGANLISDLGPIREFGLVASVGVLFAFLIFGVFMPAAKVAMDRARENRPIPEFGTSPLGSEGSLLGRILPLGAVVGRKAPIAILVVALLVSVGGGLSATTVDTTFDNEDFLPADDQPVYFEYLPEGIQPQEYTISGTLNYLQNNFASGNDDQVTVYVEGPLRQDYALESIHRANQDPPPSFVTEEGAAQPQSIISVIETRAENDPEFAALVERNDLNDNGVPDRNLGAIYDALLASESGDQARQYLTEDQHSTRLVYSVEAGTSGGEVTEDTNELVDDYRLEGTATGQTVVFQEVSTLILQSAIESLVLALVFTGVFLLAIYYSLERRIALGIANLVPIVVSVAVLAGSMPILGIPFNVLTGTILPISIGVGVAYSVHITHRFIDEYNATADAYESLLITLRGTGGALTASMLTTLGGAGSLVLAITPLLGQFGLLMSISVLYSYVLSIVILPPTLLVWARYFGDDRESPARIR